jgi:hypothetical protein
LPNLVGGTSIWKLAVDLNEAKFFDGRLLVPETEGSESLPVTVRWDLTGLVPLKEARASHPVEVGAAAADFQACLERVAKVFATPNSGFDKYKEAFTVPSLDADDGANYFYSPAKKKLFVINWGASPRSMGGKAEYVFGYEDWAKSWGDVGALAPSSAASFKAATAAAAAGGAAVAAVAAKDAKDTSDANEKDKKKEEKAKDDRGRPWWVWPLFGLVAIVLVLLALLLLRACEDKRLAEQQADAGADAATAAADSGLDASALADADVDGASADAAASGEDGGADASADAAGGDGGKAGDGGADGGKTKDGGLAANDDDDDDDATGGGGSSGGGGGKIVVTVGPGGGAKTSVHRKHYQDEAVAWRVTQGNNKVSRTEQAGHRYDVWLAPGQSFEGVRVEWQDKAGKWHPH